MDLIVSNENLLSHSSFIVHMECNGKIQNVCVTTTITMMTTTTIKCIQVKVSVLTPFISNRNTNNMWNADGVWNMRKMSAKSYKSKNAMKQFTLFSA